MTLALVLALLLWLTWGLKGPAAIPVVAAQDWTQRACADGLKVIGYMVWSLTDNFKWGSYTPRFGLYTVNVKQDPGLKRIPTPAVPAYKEIIGDDGVAPGYVPVMPQ
jgi:beta-glucosidase